MAKLEGGIFSRPRGKTGGIVFGAARTRQGKVVTSRLLVPPSNPNTAEQQTQRNKFSEALAATRNVGSNIYQTDWNRAISQLPGFQSWMSILMNNLSDTFVLTAPPATNLGTLFEPGDIAADSGGVAGELDVTWGVGLGANGTNADIVKVVVIARSAGAEPEDRVVVVDTSAIRSDGTVTIAGLPNGASMVAAVYFFGQGTAEGLLSNAIWVEGDAA